MIRKIRIFFLFGIFFIGGCSKQVLVPYTDVDQNNWVTVTLHSGDKVEGSVIQTRPHLLTLRNEKGRNVAIETSRIQQVKRIPPDYDDFGNAISEEEIAKEQTNKNATIYGFGGGLICAGASFFLGSMIAQNSEDGGTVLAATTGAGGILGTILFVKAGKKQDRKEAVLRIREDRKSTQIKRIDRTPSTIDKRESEKKKLEELRRQREKLLRELEESKKNQN